MACTPKWVQAHLRKRNDKITLRRRKTLFPRDRLRSSQPISKTEMLDWLICRRVVTRWYNSCKLCMYVLYVCMYKLLGLPCHVPMPCYAIPTLCRDGWTNGISQACLFVAHYFVHRILTRGCQWDTNFLSVFSLIATFVSQISETAVVSSSRWVWHSNKYLHFEAGKYDCKQH